MNTTTPHRLNTARGILGVGCWLLTLGLYVAAVRTTTGRSIDDHLFQRLSEVLSGSSWIPDGNALARFQVQLVVLGLGVVCAACLVNRGRPRSVLVALTVGCAPGLAAHLLKGVLTRPSPMGDFAGHNSFPSGTVAAFAGISAALTFVAQRSWQRVVACVAWSGTGLVALIVIRAHWHRPSDVIAALLLAIGAGAVASATSGQDRPVEVRPSVSRSSRQRDTVVLVARR